MEVGRDVKVPSSEFDGKVVYGEKRKSTGTATTTFLICCGKQSVASLHLVSVGTLRYLFLLSLTIM